jgi:hypothetical protein
MLLAKVTLGNIQSFRAQVGHSDLNSMVAPAA